MANVIWLGGGQADGEDPSRAVASLTALRLITGLDAAEFADALGERVGWPVPLFVYLQWERADGTPPADVLGAARQVAVDRPLGPELANESRRRFLGSVVGLSALAAAGFPMAAQPLGLGGLRPGWRASPATASDLASLVESYRRSYAGRAAVGSLLPGASGLVHVLADMAKHDQWPGPAAEVASLIGQAAVLTGLLNLMGPRDMVAAESHYQLALQAAREAQDWDLASYVLGSLAFHAVSVKRPADGRALAEATWNVASRHAAPRTRAWAGALTSELFARDGREPESRRRLDEAHAAITGVTSDPEWKGVGWFDEARLAAYEGGNLTHLGNFVEAKHKLRATLDRLPRDRIKHRSTLSADLALALAHCDEVEESCAHAIEALDLAAVISHQENVERVRRVHFRLMRWRGHPAVRQLTDRLAAA